MMNNTEKNKYTLDYVWIEKYRAIEKRGFNFSTKYHYTYDEKSNTLMRTSNSAFIDGFFDDHIEINAIVGENSVGKTSLLRAVFEVVHSLYYDEDAVEISTGDFNIHSFLKIILAFRNGKAYCFYNNLIWKVTKLKKRDDNENVELCSFEDVLLINYEKTGVPKRQQLNLPFYYHSLTLDYGTFSRFRGGDYTQLQQTDNLALSKYDISTSSLISGQNLTGYDRSGTSALIGYFHEDVRKQIEYINDQGLNDQQIFSESMGFDLPKVLNARIITNDEILSQLETYEILNESSNAAQTKLSDINAPRKELDEHLLSTPVSQTFEEIKKTVYNWRDIKNKIMNERLITNEKDALAFGLLACAIRLYIHHPSVIFPSLIIRDLYNNLLDEDVSSELTVWQRAKRLIGVLRLFSETNFIVEIENADITKRINSWNDICESLDSFIKLIDENDVTGKESHDVDIEFLGLKSKATTKFPLKFFELYTEFGRFLDFIKFSWPLSSGEEARLALFSRIYDSLKNTEDEYVYLLLDEADMLYHPRWQQNYIKNILDFLRNTILTEKLQYIQVFIATHSPIMLSDIPKQSTLFLTANANYHQNETFAANIFSLFRNSFFLNESGMGDFAFDKIEWIINQIHNQEANKDEILQYIYTVGDIYLKDKLLQEYFNEYDKPSELSQLKKEKALLEARIERLERKEES